jgi:hypothetical protein
MLAALARSYGPLCAPLRSGPKSFGRCLVAMARLAGGETRSAQIACRNESRRLPGRRARGPGASDFERCVVAGQRLLRTLQGARIAEG